jgi:hypothetical protein
MQLLEQKLWKFQRFETSCCRRRKFDGRLASTPWICDTLIETGAANDQYR